MNLAVHPLEEHPERIRILKFLHYAYSQQWVNDVVVLEDLSIASLVETLLANAPSRKHLQLKLIASAESLNKPKTYLKIAHTIIESIPSQPQNLGLSSSPQIINRFQLRFAIMQVLNPLKTKAVLMALCNLHSPSAQTRIRRPIKLEQLSACSLDELLYKVLRTYLNLEALDNALQQLASFPVEIDSVEITQLTQTLRETLRPYIIESETYRSTLPEIADFEDSMGTILMTPQDH